MILIVPECYADTLFIQKILANINQYKIKPKHKKGWNKVFQEIINDNTNFFKIKIGIIDNASLQNESLTTNNFEKYGEHYNILNTNIQLWKHNIKKDIFIIQITKSLEDFFITILKDINLYEKYENCDLKNLTKKEKVSENQTMKIMMNDFMNSRHPSVDFIKNFFNEKFQSLETQ